MTTELHAKPIIDNKFWIVERDGEKFGTAVTCLAFKQLAVSEGENARLASPPGFEPGF